MTPDPRCSCGHARRTHSVLVLRHHGPCRSCGSTVCARFDREREAMARFGYVPEFHLVPAPRETPQLCTWCTNPTLAAARGHCEATRCPFATDAYLRNPAPPSPDGSMCTFPNCDCAGDEPVCDDYLTTNGTRRLMRLRAGEPCPVHDLPEPCSTCVDVVGMPF